MEKYWAIDLIFGNHCLAVDLAHSVSYLDCSVKLCLWMLQHTVLWTYANESPVCMHPELQTVCIQGQSESLVTCNHWYDINIHSAKGTNLASRLYTIPGIHKDWRRLGRSVS